jgi:hypothetical protein
MIDAHPSLIQVNDVTRLTRVGRGAPFDYRRSFFFRAL